MPYKVSRIKRRYIEGETEVLPWDDEESLVHGGPIILGPTACSFRTISDWRIAWDRWRDVVLPKVIEFRPGTRPVAMYVLGEIEPRELITPLPADFRASFVEVIHPNGESRRHYLDLQLPFMKPEIEHLRRLGIVDGDELKRYRKWMRTVNPECGCCAVDRYPLEAGCYQ